MADYSSLLADLRALQDKISLDKRHVYRVAGKHVPGVTTVCKVLDAPMLDAWKVRVQVEGTARTAHANPPAFGEPEEEYVSRLVSAAKEQYEHERIASQAADLGSQVHALIEHAVKTQLGEPTEEPLASDAALFTFAGWREWAQRVGLRPLMAEGRVYNSAAGYCGTFDLLAEVNGSPAVLDWKPQAKVYPERRLQSAAYRLALGVTGWPPLEGYIVAMPRDGGDIQMVRLDTGPALNEATASFLNCLEVYRWLRALDKERKSEAA